MKKKKKKLKAMTLVEVIIALAIFAIMSSFLAGSVLMVCNISKKSDKMIKKISRESKAAEMLDKSAGKSTKISDGVLTIEMGSAPEVDVSYEKYQVDDLEPDSANFKFIVPIVTTAP